MKRKIIITDLTRFANPDEVCTAGYDMSTKELIRPLPYIKRSDCDRLKINPGAIIEGEFTPKADRSSPHVEDHNRDKMVYKGPCSADEFKKAITLGLFGSIELKRIGIYHYYYCRWTEPGTKIRRSTFLHKDWDEAIKVLYLKLHPVDAENAE